MGVWDFVKGKTSDIWESGKAWFTTAKTAKDAADKTTTEIEKISQTSRDELALTSARTRTFMDEITHNMNSTLNCTMQAVNSVILPEIQETASTARGCMTDLTNVAQGFEKTTRDEIVPEIKETASSARDTLKEVDGTLGAASVFLNNMTQGLHIIFILLIFGILVLIGYDMSRLEDTYKLHWGAYIEYEICRLARIFFFSAICCIICNLVCRYVLQLKSNSPYRKRALISCWIPVLVALCIYLCMLVGYCVYYGFVPALLYVYSFIKYIFLLPSVYYISGVIGVALCTESTQTVAIDTFRRINDFVVTFAQSDLLSRYTELSKNITVDSLWAKITNIYTFITLLLGSLYKELDNLGNIIVETKKEIKAIFVVLVAMVSVIVSLLLRRLEKHKDDLDIEYYCLQKIGLPCYSGMVAIVCYAVCTNIQLFSVLNSGALSIIVAVLPTVLVTCFVVLEVAMYLSLTFALTIIQPIVLIICYIYQLFGLIFGMVYYLIGTCLLFQPIYYVLLYRLLPCALIILVTINLTSMQFASWYIDKTTPHQKIKNEEMATGVSNEDIRFEQEANPNDRNEHSVSQQVSDNINA